MVPHFKSGHRAFRFPEQLFGVGPPAATHVVSIRNSRLWGGSSVGTEPVGGTVRVVGSTVAPPTRRGQRLQVASRQSFAGWSRSAADCGSG